MRRRQVACRQTSPLNNLLQEAKTIEASEGSACYFPLNNGRYEVKPGLLPFGSGLGNGQADQLVFQIDGNFAHYRQVKLADRAERLSKYYQTCDYSDAVAGAIARFIITRLTQEYPQHFSCQKSIFDTIKFHSQLTGETLYLDADWQLREVQTQGSPVVPAYASTLDALAAQVQEDLGVVCESRDGSNWVSAVHLCYPNHWSAEDKVGKDFAAVHAPVAGIEKINQRASAMVKMMIVGKPMVRFAWGLSTDSRLNHHPQTPADIPDSEWQGRHFDPDNPRLYLRIERQVIWGLSEYEAALFTIHTYFRDCRVIKKDSVLRSKLYSAIESMTPESLVYKGLAQSKTNILAWLSS